MPMAYSVAEGLPSPNPRAMAKPSSWRLENTGAAGMAGRVQTVNGGVFSLSPSSLKALTWKVYWVLGSSPLSTQASWSGMVV
jgi:hypothetical protein